MSTCFIIMPITTPEHLVPIYSDDSDHFEHVLAHLFLPAIEKAGFTPIPPKAKGAEVIQAEIIKHLDLSDLVLCDISSLNPNVFFELGVRTALNKPVCYVKDNKTPSIPFDNSIVNHYTYNASLRPWILANEVEQLSRHIAETWDRNDGANTLWRYFGLSSSSTLIKGKGEVEDRFELLNMKMDSIKTFLENLSRLKALEDVQNIRKQIQYQLAEIDGEIGATQDILAAKENFPSREEYEETLESLHRLMERRRSLVDELSRHRKI